MKKAFKITSVFIILLGIVGALSFWAIAFFAAPEIHTTASTPVNFRGPASVSAFKIPMRKAETKEEWQKRIAGEKARFERMRNSFMGAKRISLGPLRKYTVPENIQAWPIAERDNFNEEEILATTSGHVFVRGERQEDTDKIVLYNPRLNNFALMTGVIKVKLRDYSQYQSVGNDYQVYLENGHEHIRWAYYRVKNLNDINSIYAKLQSDPRVERVSLEIVEDSLKN